MRPSSTVLLPSGAVAVVERVGSPQRFGRVVKVRVGVQARHFFADELREVTPPTVCRVPTEAERAAFIRDFPEWCGPMRGRRCQ